MTQDGLCVCTAKGFPRKHLNARSEQTQRLQMLKILAARYNSPGLSRFELEMFLQLFWKNISDLILLKHLKE